MQPRLVLLIALLVVIGDHRVNAIIVKDRPVLQLTAQPTRFLLNENCVGNVMLRELQRQAILIAARDELGIRTRDIVLREPFSADRPGRVSTLLCESQIWARDKAEACFYRAPGQLRVVSEEPTTAPTGPQSKLAQSQLNAFPRVWIDFPLAPDALVDYPAFVTKCEAASRGEYLSALKSENVLDGEPARSTVWASTGAADPRAIRLLAQLDIFSQYLAVRMLHSQISDDGASLDRVDALVRGYANLVQLTENQWSQASKVFAARALLYAQRLVIHEQSSAASLYTRAYAMGMASLHASALSDLDAADKLAQPAARPEWESVIRGFCHFDCSATQAACDIGPAGWRFRSLAMFLNAVISFDDYPRYWQVQSVNQALEQNPAAFVLRSYASEMLEDSSSEQSVPPQLGNDPNAATDRIVNQLPIFAVEALRDTELPTSVKIAVKKMTPGLPNFVELAALVKSLNTAAASYDTAEPSLGVLGGLIEEQEFAGVVRQALNARSTGSLPAVQNFTKIADPILQLHLWGPYVESLGVDASTEADRLNKTLDHINERDFGGWISQALRDLNVTESERQVLINRWQVPAFLSLDDDVDDFSDDMAGAKCKTNGLENYLWQLRKTSPHSAILMASWLRSMPAARIVSETPMYEQAMNQVEAEFSDRSMVVTAAADWSDRRAEFSRSLRLLRRADQTDPTDLICDRIARTCRRLNYRTSAEIYLRRGIQLSTDANQSDILRQRLCGYLIKDKKYDQALECLQSSAQLPTPRVWQLMARCYELMGRLSDAADCLAQQATGDPLSFEQYFMWAQRVGRKDANAIGRKAVVAFAIPTDDYERAFFMFLAQEQYRGALDLMRKNLDPHNNAIDFSEAIVLALNLKDPSEAAELLKRMPDNAGDDQPDFGIAMKTLAVSGDLAVGMRAFDNWISRQLDDENAVDWYSIAGRYLIAAGHLAEGRLYLHRALDQTPRERESYFLAWRELKTLDARSR